MYAPLDNDAHLFILPAAHLDELGVLHFAIILHQENTEAPPQASTACIITRTFSDKQDLINQLAKYAILSTPLYT
jgi:hypothetical protein